MSGVPLRSPPHIVRLSREGDTPYYSVLGEDTWKLFPRLEQALLDDPGERGVVHLLQVTDFTTVGRPIKDTLNKGCCCMYKGHSLLHQPVN